MSVIQRGLACLRQALLIPCLLHAINVSAQTPDAIKDSSFNRLAKSPETGTGNGKWGWNLGLGATLNRGDTHYTRGNFSLEGERNMRDSRLLTHTLLIREQAKDEDRKDVVSVGFRGERNVDHAMFGYGDLAIDRDVAEDISRRTSLGSGIGYRIVSTPAYLLNVYTGLAAVDAVYYEAEDARGVEWLVGQDMSWQISENSRLRQRFVIYPHTVGVGGARTALQLMLSTSINSLFSLQLALLHKYQAHVPDDRQHNKLTVYTGLGVNF
ncbi:DUF481 domain-containing protein [Viridibacterium curvum]|uniref:DUF481 domain-containing protein n=1 Tax=Viridibacterium curvum TaxID=1101404 RepID=A0ABP9QN96_9RHOO